MSGCKLIYEIEYTGWTKDLIDGIGAGNQVKAGKALLDALQEGPKFCFSGKITMEECEGECPEGEVGCEPPEWASTNLKDKCITLDSLPTFKDSPGCLKAISKIAKLPKDKRYAEAIEMLPAYCLKLIKKLGEPGGMAKALKEFQDEMDKIVAEEVGPKICKCSPISEHMLRPDAISVIIQNALDKKNKRSIGG